MAAYCSFCGGICPHGDKPMECRARSTVFCRNLRDKYEGAAKPANEEAATKKGETT